MAAGKVKAGISWPHASSFALGKEDAQGSTGLGGAQCVPPDMSCVRASALQW